MIQECQNQPTDLRRTLDDYPRISQRDIDPDLGISILTPRLLSQPDFQFVKK